MLGRHSRRRGETLGRRRSRRKEDQGVWLHRYFRSKATDPSRLPGTGPRRRLNRNPTVEWSVWKVFERFCEKLRELMSGRYVYVRRVAAGLRNLESFLFQTFNVKLDSVAYVRLCLLRSISCGSATRHIR